MTTKCDAGASSSSAPSETPGPSNLPKFRPATLNDVVFIARLLREFYAKAGGTYGIAFDLESTLGTIEETIMHGVCIVGPTSCAGGMMIPFPQNGNALIGYVTFWYFQDKHEIGIFDVLKWTFKELGATHICAYSHCPKNVVGRYYKKHGMKATEVAYLAPL